MSGKISSKVEEDIAKIVFSDPKSMNAVTIDMAEELICALKDADRRARAIVLSSKGKAFCSGANLTVNPGLDGTLDDPASLLVTHYDPVIATIRDLSIPIITRIQGGALGYGASLALAGDVIIASKDAYFQQVFSRMGLVPDGGATFTLVKAIGRVRAARVMLLGERISASEAQSWGLITMAVPPEQLDAKVTEIAEQFANGPTLALGKTRQMTWAACFGSLDDAFADEVDGQRMMLKTQDHRDALAAFSEKRRPRFQGK